MSAGRSSRRCFVSRSDPLYDRMLLAAAKGWKYRPAMKDGQPVRFLKIIQVTLEGR